MSAFEITQIAIITGLHGLPPIQDTPALLKNVRKKNRMRWVGWNWRDWKWLKSNSTTLMTLSSWAFLSIVTLCGLSNLNRPLSHKFREWTLVNESVIIKLNTHTHTSTGVNSVTNDTCTEQKPSCHSRGLTIMYEYSWQPRERQKVSLALQGVVFVEVSVESALSPHLL